MGRWFRIGAFGVGGLSVVTLLGVLALLYTPPGRALIIARAEAAIEDALGGNAEITTLRGALPNHVVIENLVLTDAGAPWARIDRAELRWRALRAIGGDFDIASLIIDGGALLHEPPEKPDEDDAPFAIKLPAELPSLTIADIQINNFQSSLGGVSARVDGVGAVAMGGDRINARLNLTSAGDADTIDLTVNIAPDAERVFIDATIASQENGVVGSFADLGGPLFVEINADSPTERALITMSGLIGAYGQINADIVANLSDLAAVEANGSFDAGARLTDIEELAEPVRFNFSLQDEERGGRIKINRLLSSAGALAGDVAWAGLRENDNSLTADLRFTFAENYRPEAQEYLGRDVTLGASLERRRDDYGVDLRLRGAGLDATIANASTDLRKKITGDVTATMTPRDDLLSDPVRLTTKLAVDFDEAVALRAIDLGVGDDFRLEGAADYSFADDALRFDGDIDASPAFVTNFAPSIAPQGRITASIDAAGAADLFTMTARVETPDINLGDNVAPAFAADIALSGLPKLPTGEVTAKAINGAGDFAATLRSSQTGRIAAPAIRYTGAGFNLNGKGAFNPETQSGEIDLVYEGGDNAAPWPGVNIAGAFAAKGQFAREGRRTDLSVTSENLRVNTTRLEGFALNAAGPPDAIETMLTARRLAIAGNTPATDVSLAATINPKDDIRIRLMDMNATFADNVARLLEPGVITIANGVSLDNIRLGWSQRGRIAVDGAFSAERWRGDFDIVDINIPQTDGRATVKLSLDTNNAEPANGAFQMRSLISEENASLSGALKWDGAALTLSSLPETDALDMRLALPAKLTRAPALSVSTDGAIDGYVRYDGAIEPFAAFMPPELQTLEGFLAVNFDVSGTTENPALAGSAEITDGAYTELRSGVSIAGLHTRADANVSTTGSDISFSGGARGGGQTGADTITIGGKMTLTDVSSLDLDVTLNNAALSAFPVNTLRADGAVKIAGALDAISATGEISVRELDAEIITPETTGLVPIEVVNINDIEDDAGRAPGAKPSTISYDIKLSADDRIFVRGRGLDSEWSASLRAVSIRNEPIVLGAMRLRRGTIDFSGRRFDISRGAITFDRLSPNNPLLDIRAEFETSEGVTANIEISGRAREPNIELNSIPDLPDEDIMALVLFGKPAGELTAFESLQTAQALASLGGIGPFGGTGVTGSIRRATGLDMLNFDIDPENGGGSLTVGKYVADGLFVSATQDAQGKGGAVIVEYEITDNISVETEVRQDGDQTVSANWKKDF